MMLEMVFGAVVVVVVVVVVLVAAAASPLFSCNVFPVVLWSVSKHSVKLYPSAQPRTSLAVRTIVQVLGFGFSPRACVVSCSMQFGP
jgi:hypothetical protein